jgi:peptide/nickel transport system substrate-binding protein
MSFIRKRYYVWLFKAYVGKWKKTILASALFGVLGFFILFSFSRYYLFPLFEKSVEKIGYAGVYTIESLPPNILENVSYGLTKIDTDGKIIPGAAHKWEIKDDGKKYVFYLKKGLRFHNKKELTAKNISLSYKDVEKKVLDDYTIEYTLRSPYSPFLSSAARPLFLNNFQGLGEYKLTKMELNGGFVKSIQLEKATDNTFRKNIFFYPTQYALKIAFTLGEIHTVRDVINLSVNNTDLSKWKGVQIIESINYNELVTLFYNMGDNYLSNKKIRQALQYSLPSSLAMGERAYSPIAPTSLYFSKPPNYGVNDSEIAKELLSTSDFNNSIEISTTEEFIPVAHILANSWKAVGIKTKIKIITEIPKDFQVLLYSFYLPRDPDQYTVWHSDQVNNITRYKNLRIDKLLEDGRAISDIEKRKHIYSDFQKYLTDDAPATFLYFPKVFSVSRL